MKKNFIKIFTSASLVLILFFIWKSGFMETISDYDEFRAMILRTGLWGYFVYIFVYIVSAVFFLPALIVTIAGGVLFGPILGGSLSLIGATFGAVAAFLVSRYLARELIVKKFGDNQIFKRIDEGVKKNGKDFLILTRLIPLFPYNIQNYAYGITNIDLGKYVIITFICMAPGSFIYAYMAGEIAINGVSTKLFVQLFIAGIILFGVSQMPKYFAKKKKIDILN